MQSILLTIEKSSGSKDIWGSVLYDDNLLVDSAKTLEGLEKKFRKLLYDFHDVNPKDVSFEHAYDLTSLFDRYKYLNISAIAGKAGINPSLMRQYASGVKKVSPDTALKIERTIHLIARDLLSVRTGSSIKKERKTKSSSKKKKRQLA